MINMLIGNHKKSKQIHWLVTRPQKFQENPKHVEKLGVGDVFNIVYIKVFNIFSFCKREMINMLIWNHKKSKQTHWLITRPQKFQETPKHVAKLGVVMHLILYN